MIKLRGAAKHSFIAFLYDGYPELYSALPGAAHDSNSQIEIDIDSSLGQAWEEYDEYCG